MSTRSKVSLPVLVAAICTACAPDPVPLVALVDSRFSPECIENIKEQNRWWGKQLGKEEAVHIVVSADVSNPDYRQIVIEMNELGDNHGHVGFAGAAFDRAGRLYEGSIWLTPHSCNDPKTVAHEMGHTFNLWHRPGEENLMFRIMTGGMELNQQEIATVKVTLGVSE